MYYRGRILPSIFLGGVVDLVAQSSEKMALFLALASSSRSLLFRLSFSSLSLLFSSWDSLRPPFLKPMNVNTSNFGQTGHFFAQGSNEALKRHGNKAEFLCFCRNWFLMSPLHYLSSLCREGFLFLPCNN